MGMRRCPGPAGRLAEMSMDELAAEVRRMIEGMCRAESTVPMSPLAQRINGRMHFSCGREKGHPMPHRWPAEVRPGQTPLAEWSDEEVVAGADPGQ